MIKTTIKELPDKVRNVPKKGDLLKFNHHLFDLVVIVGQSQPFMGSLTVTVLHVDMKDAEFLDSDIDGLPGLCRPGDILKEQNPENYIEFNGVLEVES